MGKKVRILPRIPGLSSADPGQRSADVSATIAVYSVKGGVGKTTLSANLAWCSAEISKRRTLLWDLDAAGGAGFLYGIEPKGTKSAQEVFSHEREPGRLICRTAFDLIDILPGDESLRTLDDHLTRIGKRKRLAKLAAQVAPDYSRIVLDCPPVINEISSQVIRAADLIIVPLPPSPLSTRAFDLVAREIAGNGKQHPPILPVLSMVDLRRTLHREAVERNPDWPIIPYASAVEQCAVRQLPVGAFAPTSPGARAFTLLWRAIERKLAAISG